MKNVSAILKIGDVLEHKNSLCHLCHLLINVFWDKILKAAAFWVDFHNHETGGITFMTGVLQLIQIIQAFINLCPISQNNFRNILLWLTFVYMEN